MRFYTALFVQTLLLAPIGLAHAQTASADEAPSETLGRLLSATNEGVQAFGSPGGAPGIVTAKSLVGAGTGSQKRAAARQLNTAYEGWRNASAATKSSLPYRVAPTLFAISDTAALLAPAIEGDGKGVVSGAVNIGVSSLATAGGAAAGSSLFAAIGGTVGTFVFPVAGTAAGAMVGGAIGTITGGFVASIAYDRYGKSVVGNIVEGGLSVLFDPDPRRQAIEAREDFLRKQAAPELQAAWDYNTSVGASYGQEEEQLFKPLRGVYELKAPPAGAAVGPVIAWDTVKRIKFVSWVTGESKSPVECSVNAQRLTCHGAFDFSIAHIETTQNGTADSNTVAFQEHVRIIYSDTQCRSVYEVDSTSRHTLLPGGKETFHSFGGTGRWISFAGQCGRTDLIPKVVQSPPVDGVGTWQVLE